ncbi:hypothetical protein M430DRAFT_24627 [Amorphotheca resinae ATCC 22711]|uniref:Aminoglycoside phosphotransferase domain-containing protein n=1 Tax=Amorphotheca resinae ATCC 22711 TaxID=857342 RepID=A0A2T3BFS9_AMORE|nr:hypothetical protein M430DRAFT_24627 [Amorphotheca resinae ATCC 22711]PSS28280.1 hypothetical protein M430DRAFT_24627 [Amorphotheca resinae ATCC 22711]
MVANKFKRNNLTIDFSKESLCFCYSDLYEGNVMFTDTGTLYIIDFEHAAFLPTSFMTLSLSLDRPINEALRNKLSLPQENLNAMQAARYYFQISGHGVGLPLDDPWRDIKRKRRSPNAHQPPNPMSDNTEHLPSGCRTNSTESDA